MTEAMQTDHEVMFRIKELLECIHVSHKYALLTQKPLPPELDYFAQSIVGNLTMLQNLSLLLTNGLHRSEWTHRLW